jgi:hypothetical protein
MENKLLEKRMKKNVKIFKNIILTVSALFIMFVTGCATTLNLNITRPAELDLNGATSIAVLPFGTTGFSNKKFTGGRYPVLDFFVSMISEDKEQRDFVNYMHKTLEADFAGSEYLKLINSDAVKSAVDRGADSPADVYVTGKLGSFHSEIKNDTRKVKKGEKTVVEEVYYRKANYSFEYQIVDGNTSQVYYSSSFYGSTTSDEYDSKSSVPSELAMFRDQIDSEMASIVRKVQPYNINKSIVLMKDKSKDPRMEEANKLAKNGSIEKSRELFESVYNSTGLMEAGYNAAAILEAQGKYEEARTLAEELVQKTGHKKAIRLRDDINYEINMSEKLKRQNEAREK